MKILITGGTGFIGSHLVKKLLARGDQLHLLTRQNPPPFQHQAVVFLQSLANLNDLNDFDAVINLAGEPIFDKRWTVFQKQKLIESRVQLTTRLAELINQSSQPPHTFISASATGFYGDLPQTNMMYGEDAPTSGGFTTQLCRMWEASALKAQDRTRLCLVRTGIVLAKEGGALKKMLPLFQCGLGGKLGSGKQYWAWISLADYLNGLLFLLDNPACSGAYNFVAPTPVTNAEFTAWLAKQCHRPACFTAPKFLLKGLLGERSSILLDNQPLVPKRLSEAGFQFQHAHLDMLNL